jgi:hypothetical protein
LSVVLDGRIGRLALADDLVLPVVRPGPQRLLAELLQGDAQPRFRLIRGGGIGAAQFHDVQQRDDLRQQLGMLAQPLFPLGGGFPDRSP